MFPEALIIKTKKPQPTTSQTKSSIAMDTCLLSRQEAKQVVEYSRQLDFITLHSFTSIEGSSGGGRGHGRGCGRGRSHGSSLGPLKPRGSLLRHTARISHEHHRQHSRLLLPRRLHSCASPVHAAFGSHGRGRGRGRRAGQYPGPWWSGEGMG